MYAKFNFLDEMQEFMPLSHSVSRLMLYALANNTANVTLCYAVEGEIEKIIAFVH